MLKPILITRFARRCFSSSLYITGDKAHNNFSVLTPHLDVEQRLENKEALERNVKARCLNIDIEGVERRWTFYIHLLDRKDILGYTKAEIGKELSRLMKDDPKNEEEIEKLKNSSKLLKDEYSTLKEYLYGVEESAALKALSLPNVLHSKTPLDKEMVIYTHLEPPLHESKSHIDIGIEQNLLEYSNNSFVFLINDAAIFEYSITNYFHNNLLDCGYTQFSNADFTKSVIIEGCGTDFSDKDQAITLREGNNHAINRLHLTGGASHYAFMAYFTKYSLQSNQLPLRIFASGRKYEPMIQREPSLLNLVQQSAVELFVASSELDDDLNASFDEIVTNTINVYKPLGLHFRLVLLPANKIRKFESLRLSIQMFSNHKQSYVEVGNVSISDDYLSKRLLFTYNSEQERKFPKIVSGNLLNVQKVLACVLENRANLLSDLLNQYAPL